MDKHYNSLSAYQAQVNLQRTFTAPQLIRLEKSSSFTNRKLTLTNYRCHPPLESALCSSQQVDQSFQPPHKGQ